MIAPVPNCGHASKSYTHIAIANTWMCPKCIASIGALYARCSICCCYPAQLVTRFGRKFCFTCSRGVIAPRHA